MLVICFQLLRGQSVFAYVHQLVSTTPQVPPITVNQEFMSQDRPAGNPVRTFTFWKLPRALLFLFSFVNTSDLAN